MELYLDTSALVKLYFAEPDRETVLGAIHEASQVATSMVAYAEARAAFARRLREGTLALEEHRRVVTSFNSGWGLYDRVPVTDAIARLAGNLAEQHALRGFDAIHLASAVALDRNVDNLNLRFLTFDERLLGAARHVVGTYEIH